MARMGSPESHSRGLRGNISSIVARVEADASGGLVVKNGAGRREVIGVRSICKATSAGGDCEINTGAGAVSTVVMATLDAVVQETVLDVTYSVIEPYADITFTCNGAADRGIVIIETVEA